MNVGEVVQLIGSIVACVVVLNELIKHFKEWRGGSPELRLLRDQIKFQNEGVLRVLDSVADRVNSIDRKVGA